MPKYEDVVSKMSENLVVRSLRNAAAQEDGSKDITFHTYDFAGQQVSSLLNTPAGL